MSTFEIKTIIGDPSTVWAKLDAGTQGLILFLTGIGLLAVLIVAVLSMYGHSVRGSIGESMDVQGSRNTAFMGMIRTAGYVLACLFFIGLVGLVFKLYG